MESYKSKNESLTKVEIEGVKFECDKDGYVNFGEVARRLLNQQSQYASRYMDGALDEYPNLGHGLRFQGEPLDYHSLKIHKDDIEQFVSGVREHKKSNSPF